MGTPQRLLLRSYKSPFEAVSAERSTQHDTFGRNVGNLVFSEAAHKILSTPTTEVAVDDLRTLAGLAAMINAEHDALVVPLANAFRPDFEPTLQRLTRLIERLTVPVVILGVGAQSDVDGDLAPLAGIEASVRAFVGAVLERGPSIGVRGEFTGDYLRGLGFRDVEVIGCPSMFRHGPVLPELRFAPVGDPADARDLAIAVNGSHDAFRSQGLGALALAVRERAGRAVYFGQDNMEADQLRWRDTSTWIGTWTELPCHPDNPFYRAGDARFHVDPSTWIEELRGFDYAFGSRIHGSIAALLAGTPAYVVNGDARTLELCRYFEIPHRPLAGLGEDADPIALLADADWGPLQRNHAERWARFEAYLDAHGLPNTFASGDGGAAFEERLAAVDLPPPITPSTLDDLAASRAHVAWLREEMVGMERAQRRLTRARAAEERARAAAAAAAPVRAGRLRRPRR